MTENEAQLAAAATTLTYVAELLLGLTVANTSNQAEMLDRMCFALKCQMQADFASPRTSATLPANAEDRARVQAAVLRMTDELFARTANQYVAPPPVAGRA